MSGSPEDLTNFDADNIADRFKDIERFEKTFCLKYGLFLWCDKTKDIFVSPVRLRQFFADFLVLLKKNFDTKIELIFDLVSLNRGRLMNKYKAYRSMKPYTELTSFLSAVWINYVYYKYWGSNVDPNELDWFQEDFQKLKDGIEKIIMSGNQLREA